MTLELKSKHSLNISKPPACLAFHPINTQLFLIGTYELEKDDEEGASAGPQRRTGSLVLASVSASEITILDEKDLEYGVLDLRFSPVNAQVWATANSTGSVSVGAIQDSKIMVARTFQFEAIAEDVLCLSLAWYPVGHNDFAVSCSDGRIMYCSWGKNAQGTIWTKAEERSKHELEAWTVVFHDKISILSGGDDCAFQNAIGPGSTPETIWSNKKIHGAGVTAILPLLSRPSKHTIHHLTGSYDEKVRVIRYDVQTWRLEVVAELDLGGGVWRLELMDQTPKLTDMWFTVLASCMHAGSAILEVTKTGHDWNIEVKARFTEHKSMNYASGLGHLEDKTPALVSTSFYDKLVCLWDIDDHRETLRL